MANALQIEFLLSGLKHPTSGEVLASGYIYTYEAGTTTPKATWADASKSVTNANPLTLGVQGDATVYADGNYKFAVYDADDNLVFEFDNLWYGKASPFKTVTTVLADYTADADDELILVNAQLAAVTVYLPSAATVSGKEYVIVKTDSTANAITIEPAGSETINGEANYSTTAQYGQARITSNGSNWLKEALDVSPLALSILAETTAGGMLTLLGVSSFAQTLLDDADAATALSTLGVSAFAQTVLDDADAAAVKTTLGVADPVGYINGLTPSYKDADEITFSSGVIEYKGATKTLAASLDKQFTSLGNSTWYYVYIHETADALDADSILWSDTAPAWDDTYKCYTNVNDYRCIAVFKTDGSGNILPFVVSGGWWFFKDAESGLFLSTITPATSKTSVSVGAPPLGRLRVSVHAFGYNATATPSLYLESGESACDDVYSHSALHGQVNNRPIAGDFDLMTDSSGQVVYFSNAATDNDVHMCLRGFSLPKGLAA